MEGAGLCQIAPAVTATLEAQCRSVALDRLVGDSWPAISADGSLSWSGKRLALNGLRGPDHLAGADAVRGAICTLRNSDIILAQ